MRALTPFEVLTALAYGYLGIALPWNTPFTIVQGLHFATVVVAGLALAVAAWRRASWVPKATLVLAAWVGIPTFAGVAAIVRLASERPGPAVVLSFGILFVANICQLFALVIAMRYLEFRHAAV